MFVAPEHRPSYITWHVRNGLPVVSEGLTILFRTHKQCSIVKRDKWTLRVIVLDRFTVAYLLYGGLLAVLPVLFFHEITNLYSKVSVYIYVTRYFCNSPSEWQLFVRPKLKTRRVDVCAFLTLLSHQPHLNHYILLFNRSIGLLNFIM